MVQAVQRRFAAFDIERPSPFAGVMRTKLGVNVHHAVFGMYFVEGRRFTTFEIGIWPRGM